MDAGKYAIRDILATVFDRYRKSYPVTPEQASAVQCIIRCKTGDLGYNYYECQECGYVQKVSRSCGNRNCPNCQAVEKALWLEQRKSEVIDAPYFHIVGTLPHELNPLLTANRKALYELLHQSMGRTVTQLAGEEKYLGASPGIIQILHTWDQKMDYHVHVHQVVSGGGLTRDRKLVTLPKDAGFFIPVKVVAQVMRGKFLDGLKRLYDAGRLTLPAGYPALSNPCGWKDFIDGLYRKEWNVHIKETFNGNGNAIEYLARYANRIAISNSRIVSFDEETVTFEYIDRKDDCRKKRLALPILEFIRRFLTHVLPKGFQKIRYYGFLNNSTRRKNLDLIFKQQGGRKYEPRFDKDTPVGDIASMAWGIASGKCPCCEKLGVMFALTSEELDHLDPNAVRKFSSPVTGFRARADPLRKAG